jgi:hypothetical protein
VNMDGQVVTLHPHTALSVNPPRCGWYMTRPRRAEGDARPWRWMSTNLHSPYANACCRWWEGKVNGPRSINTDTFKLEMAAGADVPHKRSCAAADLGM